MSEWLAISPNKQTTIETKEQRQQTAVDSCANLWFLHSTRRIIDPAVGEAVELSGSSGRRDERFERRGGEFEADDIQHALALFLGGSAPIGHIRASNTAGLLRVCRPVCACVCACVHVCVSASVSLSLFLSLSLSLCRFLSVSICLAPNADKKKQR